MIQKVLFKFIYASVLVLFLFGMAHAQTEVSGTVTEEGTGEALPGVNIFVKSSPGVGTSTNLDGYFELEVPSLQDTLVFSFLGFERQEVAIDGREVVDVELTNQTFEGDELIVIGYGTQRRSDVTGAVSSVPRERLENLPVTNVTQALQGTTAGLNITTRSSVPGSVGNVQVRGLNSITADNSAFIVVDGTPFYGSLNDINTSDIESIEILKDASATAIYGNRGSNGVVLITTKQGNVGKPVINYNVSQGFEDFSNVLEPMGPEAYVQKYADYMEQRGLEQTDVLPNTAEIENYNAGRTNDWLDTVTRRGLVTEHNISLSGGTENARYFVSGGYLDQKGIIEGYQYNRFNLRANLDLTVTDWLRTGFNATYANNQYDGGRANFLFATAMSPYSVPTNESGEYIIYPMSPEQLFVNPMLGLTTERVDHVRNLSGTAFAVVEPWLEGLQYRVNASYYRNPRYNATYSGRLANDNNGTAYKYNSQRDRWVLENILSYNHEIDAHSFDVTMLYSAEKEIYQNTSITGVGFFSDALLYHQIGSADNISGGSSKYEQTWLSQMGRLNYSYDSRYLFSFTARRDGASVFGSNTSKYGFFPSVALGWNIANESFMEEFDDVDEIKLRFSYGTTGNPAIGVYGTQSTAGTILYPFGGSPQVGTYIAGMGNPNLKWESTTTANLGVDFGFFRNRITGSVEVYDSKTTNLILSRNIPNTTGSGSILDNIGEVGNQGIDVTLNTENINTGNFRWESTFIFSTYKNEILALYGNDEDDIDNRWFIGNSLGVVYDYEKIGIWQEDEIAANEHLNHDPTARPGDIKFADLDGDGQIDSENDRRILGSSLPSWTGGLTNTFHYRNFTLNLFLETAQGILRNNSDIYYTDEVGRRNIPADMGYWTSENASNEWPSLIAYQNNKGYGHPKDASYLRIKDVRLSYNIPQSLLQRYGIQNMTVYFAGRNLYTFTDWQGWDPESNQAPRGSGDWTDNYPLVRTLSFGLNISL
ncbi:TonB-dependent receptor [Rhodohalobacter sp. SW132]|uniref:SusC/RagA family TonB-linked outer membrane protein n=1 Tax=Rhodohalobacter sp. SW132 TaxID=2293433 RepID=UPI0018F7BC08|nr:TonB-dependent receptor [Rhodohalobacter sp. SW132]